MPEGGDGSSSPPKAVAAAAAERAPASLPPSLQKSDGGDEEKAAAADIASSSTRNDVAAFDLDFDQRPTNADADDLLLDWRRYSDGNGFSDYGGGVSGIGSRALRVFLQSLAFLGRRAGLRDDYSSSAFVAASLPPAPPAWWLRQTRARKKAILLCGVALLSVGTIALAVVAAAVALRSSGVGSDDFLSDGGGGAFGGGAWPASGAPECAWRSWRLPEGAVTPKRYRLSLGVEGLEDDGRQPWVEGEVSIDVFAPGGKRRRCVVLHAADPVRIESASITFAAPRKENERGNDTSSPFDVSSFRIKKWRHDRDLDQLTLLLPDEGPRSWLEPGKAATLRLRFGYELPDALEGFYRSTWTEEAEDGGGEGSGELVLRAAAVTQFEANSARRAFPCFDEPALRAPFEVSLIADEGYEVVSNMPKASVEEVSGDSSPSTLKKSREKKKTRATPSRGAPRFPPPPSPPRRRTKHVFEPTPPMPTYLVAAVVGPLVAVPGGVLLPPPATATREPPPPPQRTLPPTSGGAAPPGDDAFEAAADAAGLPPWPSRDRRRQEHERPLTLFGRRAAAPLLRKAASAARGALAHHERQLGTRYALPHLQVVAVPDFAANAMENWGAVTFREAALLLLDDDDESGDESGGGRERRRLLPSPNSASAERRVSLTIAHELAHMFFGDATGFSWWGELWLSESFATYFEHSGAAAALERVYRESGGDGGGGDDVESREASPSPVVDFFDSFYVSTASVGLRSAARSNSGHSLSVGGVGGNGVAVVGGKSGKGAGGGRGATTTSLGSDSSIESMFDSIEYEHGAGVLRMLRSYLNARRGVSSSPSPSSLALDDAAAGGGASPRDDAFLAGLRDYLRANAFGAADSGRLFEALRARAVARRGDEEEEVEEGEAKPSSNGDNVSEWMRSWTSFRGAPLLVVRASEETGEVRLEQATLMSSGGGEDGSGVAVVACDDAATVAPDGTPASPSKADGSRKAMPPWWIPLRLSTSDDPTPRWLWEEGGGPSARRRPRALSSCSTSAPVATLAASPSSSSPWVKINAGAAAPVRVSYPPSMWKALSDAAALAGGDGDGPPVSGADLAQLLADADALSEASSAGGDGRGAAPISAFLNLTRALGRRERAAAAGRRRSTPPSDLLGAWRAAASGLRRMQELVEAGGDGKCSSDLRRFVSGELLSGVVSLDGGGEGGGDPALPAFRVVDEDEDGASPSSPPWSLLRPLPRSAPNGVRETRALVLGLAADFGGGGADLAPSPPRDGSFGGVAWAALRGGLRAREREESEGPLASSPSFAFLGDADARETLYSSAVSAGGREAFEAVKKIYEENERGGSARGGKKTKKSADPAESERALFALADASDESLALEVLEYALSDAVRSQDAPSLVAAVATAAGGSKVRSGGASSASSSRRRRLVWEWLVERGGAAKIAAKKNGERGSDGSGDEGARAVGKLFASIGSGLASPSSDLGELEAEIERAAKTVKKRSGIAVPRRQVERALEGVRARASWRRYNAADACAWLATEAEKM